MICELCVLKMGERKGVNGKKESFEEEQLLLKQSSKNAEEEKISNDIYGVFVGGTLTSIGHWFAT